MESPKASALKAAEKMADQATAAVVKFIEQGAGPVTGSIAYADDRRAQFDGDVDRAIRRIVNETTAATGATGFVTGLGGLATLPAAIPASLAGSMLLNARMVGSIAHLRGWELDDHGAQTMILLTAAGVSAHRVLTEFGVKVGQQVAMAVIKQIPITVIRAVNKKAGFMLLAKYGTTRSALTLAKAVPIVGGVVSGGVDAGFTRVVAKGARQAFPLQ